MVRDGTRKRAQGPLPLGRAGRGWNAAPTAANRIWILDTPLEEWLAGSVGSSQCCSVCGDSECRTLEVSGTTFEAIPERLILKAALLAAAQLLDDTTGWGTLTTRP